MFQSVTIVGRVGKEGELRYMKSGVAVMNVSIGVSEKFTKKDGSKHESTEWFTTIFTGKFAETMQPLLVKGTLLLVSGKIKTRKWEDKNGVTRYSTELFADEVKILSSRDNKQSATVPENREDTPFTADDIPF